MEEFHRQAELEIEQGQSPTMPERGVRLDKFQLGFLGFIKPYFQLVGAIEGINIGHLISNLDANINEWKNLKTA